MACLTSVLSWIIFLLAPLSEAGGGDLLNLPTGDAADKIKVHFVPHSHMDAGWLKTYDAYFEHEVTRIFTTVFEELDQNPTFTYTLGDIAFFRRYYTAASKEENNKIKQLVKNGQLEFVHGGMVSTDEATPSYADIIRNFELGHDFLKQEFGYLPKIGWQLDPFGHSAANAELFSQMGLEAMVVGRINEDDFRHRKLAKELEFVWTPRLSGRSENDSEGSDDEPANEIFTHVHTSRYTVPFEVKYDRQKLISRGDRHFGAVGARKFVESFQTYVQEYRTKNVLVLWGEDFAHQDASGTYSNLVTVITEINEWLVDHNLSAEYELTMSSMRNYFDEVFEDGKAANVEWPRETGDFWQYNYMSVKGAYWTGYFTTYPDFKKEATQFGDFAQSMTMIEALNTPGDESERDLEGDFKLEEDLLEVLSVMQHHDAMTGTHMVKVGADYSKMMRDIKSKALTSGHSLAEQIIEGARMHGIGLPKGVHYCSIDGYHTLDCSEETNEKKYLVAVFNPNLAPLHGLFLQTTREKSNVSISAMSSQTFEGPTLFSEDQLQPIETEVHCSLSAYALEKSDDSCRIFVNVESGSLQFTYLKVDILDANEDFEVLIPEIVFSSLPETRLNTIAETNSDEALVMTRDVSISMVDGQSLRLHKIRDFLDPVILTYRRSPGEKAQTFRFSLQTMDDSTEQSKQNSGHYSFTTTEKTADTDSLVGLREIHVTQGDFIASIDLIFFDESLMHRMKNICDANNFMKCLQEKEDYQQALRADYIKACIEEQKDDPDFDEDLARSDCEQEHPVDNLCPNTQKENYNCLFSLTNREKPNHKLSKELGRISFIVQRDHFEIHQKVDLPRIEVENGKKGKEVFAVWTPDFAGGLYPKYQTDANGLELITRRVYQKNTLPVSSSFYPVTTFISASDLKRQIAMSVMTDRPQAGSVHYDGTIKLLVDRRVLTGDEGGIPEKMNMEFDHNLKLNFRFEFTDPKKITASNVQRKRDILTVYANEFRFLKTDMHISNYAEHSDALVSALRELAVDQITLTRLPVEEVDAANEHFLQAVPTKTVKVRVRLDLADPRTNPLTPEMLESLLTLTSDDPFGRVMLHLCSLMAYELGSADVQSLCQHKATVKITGLLGIPSSVQKMKFQSGTKGPINLLKSRFVTFELDLTGEQSLIHALKDSNDFGIDGAVAGEDDSEEDSSVTGISILDAIINSLCNN